MEPTISTHWENIYTTKQAHEVSWTQAIPALSLAIIKAANLDKNAKIIDIGGGDSHLVDHLLAEGYTNISVLDISAKALERAQARLGDAAKKVTWIVSDILTFEPSTTYDFWHDRAAFHFQTTAHQIEQYLKVVKKAVNGKLVIASFSVDGPQKCSGLSIQQYDEASMQAVFERIHCKALSFQREDHITPSGAIQNFVYGSFELA